MLLKSRGVRIGSLKTATGDPSPPDRSGRASACAPLPSGHGETIAIARGVTTCPLKAVKAWLQAAGISEGPLFRPVAKGGRLGAQWLTDKSVCDLVKAYAARIGLKATDFGAHSLRAGFLTSAARRGAAMDVLQAYVRNADLFRDHAGAGLL